MDEAVGEGFVEGDKGAERHHTGDGAVELPTEMARGISMVGNCVTSVRRCRRGARWRCTCRRVVLSLRLNTLPASTAFDAAMDQQVRVAPDGRREVGVMVVGEAKMPGVVRR